MNTAGKSEEFDALWRESTVRAGRRPTWSDLSLEEQKALSSKFRDDMERYGDEDPIAVNRMKGGLYSSPKSSSRPG